MAANADELQTKFQIFKDYADAIGINNVPEIDSWKAHE